MDPFMAVDWIFMEPTGNQPVPTLWSHPDRRLDRPLRCVVPHRARQHGSHCGTCANSMDDSCAPPSKLSMAFRHIDRFSNSRVHRCQPARKACRTRHACFGCTCRPTGSSAGPHLDRGRLSACHGRPSAIDVKCLEINGKATRRCRLARMRRSRTVELSRLSFPP